MYTFSPQGDLADKHRRLGGDALLVLEDVTVIDGTGAAPRAGSTLVIKGDKIVSETPRGTKPDVPAEPAPTRLPVAGHFVTPGLIDCHVHITGYSGHDPYRRHIERYPAINTLRAARDAHRVLAAGFTTVRHLGHGDPDHTQGVRDSIQQGLIAGPRMLTSRYAMSQSGGHGNLPGWPYHLVEEMRPRAAFVDGPDACRKFVRRLLGDGADVIKIYTTEGLMTATDRQLDLPNFTDEEIEAITDEAHRRGVRVAAHATGLEGSKSAVRGGVDTLEHGPNDLDEELIRLLVKTGASLVPTLTVFEWASTNGPADGLPQWAADRAGRTLPGRRAMALAAQRAGVPLGLGTDSGAAPRGGQNAEEAIAMVRAGIPLLEAIRAATSGGARALGIADQVGTVAPGKIADLLVLRRDPSADVAVLADPTALRFILQGRPVLERAS